MCATGKAACFKYQIANKGINSLILLMEANQKAITNQMRNMFGK